jgi:hypothetical protein
MRPATVAPRGSFDKLAAIAPAYISPEQASRPWSKHHAAPNILHYFSLPSHPPEGRPQTIQRAPEPLLPEMEAEPTEPPHPAPGPAPVEFPDRHRPWILTEAEKAAIRAQEGNGKSYAALAAEYKVSRQAVWTAVNGPTVKFTAERRAEIKRRWLAGEDRFALSREFHITTRTLHKLVLGDNASGK